MCTRQEVLAAAAARRLVGLLDVVDRAHMLWLAADGSTVEASQADTRLVLALMDEGLVQLGTRRELVAYGRGEALGARLLPTEQGVARLQRLRERAELAAAADRVRGAA